MRNFDGGATRDDDEGKYDYEGFLSPLVLEAYAKYMHKHRKQADGSMRGSDNWQAGIPKDVYIKSLWRHFIDVWFMHRYPDRLSKEDLEESLCAVLFNTMGYLFEELEGR